MTYRDLIAAGQFPMPPSHPYLVELVIDPADWCRFQQLADDNPATIILGHDDPNDGWLTAYIACASHETQRRLEDGWA